VERPSEEKYTILNIERVGRDTTGALMGRWRKMEKDLS
jgi:hypothetical protein